MSPMLWAQLLIINVEFDGGIYFPALFAVLPSKKTSAYTKVFSEVKKALHNLGIGHLLAEQCMADFEMSLRNAWEDIFDYVELKNCRFHYTKVKFHLCKPHTPRVRSKSRINTNRKKPFNRSKSESDAITSSKSNKIEKPKITKKKTKK